MNTKEQIKDRLKLSLVQLKKAGKLEGEESALVEDTLKKLEKMEAICDGEDEDGPEAKPKGGDEADESKSS